MDGPVFQGLRGLDVLMSQRWAADRFGGVPKPRLEPPARVRRMDPDLTGFYEQTPYDRPLAPGKDPLMVQINQAGSTVVGWFATPAGGVSSLASWAPTTHGDLPPYVNQPGVFIADRSRRTPVGADIPLLWMPGKPTAAVNDLDPTDLLRAFLHEPDKPHFNGTFHVRDARGGGKFVVGIQFDTTIDAIDSFELYAPGVERLPHSWYVDLKSEPARRQVRATEIAPMSPTSLERRVRSLVDPAGAGHTWLGKWLDSAGGTPQRKMLRRQVLSALYEGVHCPEGYEPEMLLAMESVLPRVAATFKGTSRNYYDWYSIAFTEEQDEKTATGQEAQEHPPGGPKPPKTPLERLGFGVDPEFGYAYRVAFQSLGATATSFISLGGAAIRMRIRRFDHVQFKMATPKVWVRDEDGNAQPVNPKVLDDPKQGRAFDPALTDPHLDGVVVNLGAGLAAGWTTSLGGGSASGAAASSGAGPAVREMTFYTRHALEMRDFDGAAFSFTALRAPGASAGIFVSGNVWSSVLAVITLRDGRRLRSVRTDAWQASGPTLPKFSLLVGGWDGFVKFLNSLGAAEVGIRIGQIAYSTGHVWFTGGDTHEPSPQTPRAQIAGAGAQDLIRGGMVFFDRDSHLLHEEPTFRDGRTQLEVFLATYRRGFLGLQELGLTVYGSASPEGTVLYNKELSSGRCRSLARAVMDAFAPVLDKAPFEQIPVGEQWAAEDLGPDGNPPDDLAAHKAWMAKRDGVEKKWRWYRSTSLFLRGRLLLVGTEVESRSLGP